MNYRLQKFHPLFLLSILFWVVSFYLFQKYGVKIVNDSRRYLDYAEIFRGGFYFEQHNFWYFGYVLFIYSCSLISSSLSLLIFAQYLFSFISLIFLYKTSELLFENKIASITTALLYILFLDILQWNSYILAESFFTSLTCLSLYYLALIRKGKRHLLIHAFGILSLAMTFLAKPTGLVFLIAFLAIIISHYFKRITLKYLKWSIGIAIIASILMLADLMLTTFQIIENYQLGEIIYAVRTVHSIPNLDGLVVIPMAELTLPKPHASKIWMIMQFIIHNPLYWFELFFKKVFYFLIHIRPYWSNTHNIISIAFLVPCYVFFLKYVCRKSANKQIVLFSTIYILMHAVSIGLTSVDWDGRFLIPVLPVVFLLVGQEFTLTIKKASDSSEAYL